jgi:hypothetical protein
MNYEEKLNECTKRVYKCNYSQKQKSTKKLEWTIDRDTEKKPKFDMNEDIDNIILIVVDHLGLPPYMADRTKLIMAKMWSYPGNFHYIKYENAVLGVLMYVVYEDLHDAVTVDFIGLCTLMFGLKKLKEISHKCIKLIELCAICMKR